MTHDLGFQLDRNFVYSSPTGDFGRARSHMRHLTRVVSALVAVTLACVLSSISYADEIGITEQAFTTKEGFAKYREAAWAHFRSRCKESAGEKIYRTVKNVETVFLLKPRTRPTETDLRDQYWMGDPYAFVLNPQVEISRYLYNLDENGIATTRQNLRRGYKAVEAPDREGSKTLRYQLDTDTRRITMVVSDERRSRYAISWDDISTREDRAYWVAGSRLHAIDLSTNEILGERIGYLIDAGLGTTSGARAPWLHARLYAGSLAACPPIRRNTAMDRLFVEKVLSPPSTGE